MTQTTMAQPEIITLTARGLIADVRLHALDLAEFHVHSVILKMQSNFFFKFLDSVDNSTATGGRFKYEWITKVDDDGSWSLVAAKDGKVRSLNDTQEDVLIEFADRESGYGKVR